MPGRGWLVVSCLACLQLARCGGDGFSQGAGGSGASTAGGSAGGGNAGSSSGGQSGSGGTSKSGGSAGQAPTGGGPDAAGAGGEAGSPAESCDCASGSYCRDGSTECEPCSSLSRLRFSVPERLAAAAPPGALTRSPRPGKTATDLLYAVDGDGLHYTPDYTSNAGNLVMASSAEDRSAQLLSGDVTSLSSAMPFNLVFDRQIELTKRKLFFGQWLNDLVSATQAPAPFNGNGASDFGATIALQPAGGTAPRLFWMTDRDLSQPLQLVTALLTQNGAGAPVSLHLGEANCQPSAEDLTPWVSADGRTLLVSALSREPGCLPGAARQDIYITALQPSTGQPPTDSAAIPLPDVNGLASETDPSFSADLCQLYFVSDREGSRSIYRASRR